MEIWFLYFSETKIQLLPVFNIPNAERKCKNH